MFYDVNNVTFLKLYANYFFLSFKTSNNMSKAIAIAHPIGPKDKSAISKITIKQLFIFFELISILFIDKIHIYKENFPYHIALLKLFFLLHIPQNHLLLYI